jgi:hypothetical protein
MYVTYYLYILLFFFKTIAGIEKIMKDNMVEAYAALSE